MYKEKVLIIKLGYSETLDGEIGKATSLGDVLRSTVLLHLYKNANVTWLVDEKAFQLLKGNPYIHRIIFYDLTSVLQLQSERFDTLINLEKVPGLCAFSDSLKAWRRYGFRFDPEKMVLRLPMTALSMYWKFVWMLSIRERHGGIGKRYYMKW